MLCCFFFFNDTATTEIYTLSLHDALPISGRVQSVAVKIIVDREREVEDFKPEEYWEISAELEKNQNKYLAHLIKKEGKPIEIKNEKTAKEIESDLKKEEFKVVDVIKKEIKKSPAPPFITSTLQQESAHKLHFSSKKTMVIEIGRAHV